MWPKLGAFALTLVVLLGLPDIADAALRVPISQDHAVSGAAYTSLGALWDSAVAVFSVLGSAGIMGLCRSPARSRWWKSNDLTWAASASNAVVLGELVSGPESAGYRNPAIMEMVIRFSYDITTTAGNAFDAQDLPRILDRLRVKDGCGDLVDLTGHQLRTVAQIEYGDAYQDPAQIAGGTTNGTGNIYWKLPFAVPYRRGGQRLETALPLKTLKEIRINTTAATLFTGRTVNSGTWQVWCRIADLGPSPRPRMRMQWKRDSWTTTQADFTVGGRLRAMFAQGTASAAGYNAWAAATEIDSAALGYVDMTVRELQEFYGSETRGAESDGVLQRGGEGVPLYWPDADQEVGEMPDIDSLTLQSSAALPNNNELVTCVITNHGDENVSAQLGVTNPDAARAIINERGAVEDASGDLVPASMVSGDLRAKLPMRILSPAEAARLRKVAEAGFVGSGPG